jgi:hypothetical protein
VIVCDLEISTVRWPRLELGSSATVKRRGEKRVEKRRENRRKEER